jgi:hypothetical protein
MKLSSRPPRMPSTLPDSLHHRLTMYVLAAGATAVGMVMSVESAGAKVIYTPADKCLPLNHNSWLDLNHDGVNDFYFYLRSSHGFRSSWFVRELFAASPGSQSINGVYCVGTNCNAAAALRKGTKVGPNSPFARSPFMFWKVDSSQHSSQNTSIGRWRHVTQGYLGLRFVIKGQFHYGWARLGPTSDNKPPKAKLTGYAYETIPNKPIVTGRTEGPDVIAVQPASLGRLAKGRK